MGLGYKAFTLLLVEIAESDALSAAFERQAYLDARGLNRHDVFFAVLEYLGHIRIIIQLGHPRHWVVLHDGSDQVYDVKPIRFFIFKRIPIAHQTFPLKDDLRLHFRYIGEACENEWFFPVGSRLFSFLEDMNTIVKYITAGLRRKIICRYNFYGNQVAALVQFGDIESQG